MIALREVLLVVSDVPHTETEGEEALDAARVTADTDTSLAVTRLLIVVRDDHPLILRGRAVIASRPEEVEIRGLLDPPQPSGPPEVTGLLAVIPEVLLYSTSAGTPPDIAIRPALLALPIAVPRIREASVETTLCHSSLLAVRLRA